jgi:5-methylcytosine-specific restriction endonuclease McrA
LSYSRLKKVSTQYPQPSIRKRIEQFFLDNLGVIVTREQLQQVATNPTTGITPENWHQRLSELRTDIGYTILSWRDTKDLTVSEYVMPSAEKREGAKSRKAINRKIKTDLLKLNPQCSYSDCNLRENDIDPIGGGTVKLQVDHKTAHNHEDQGDNSIDNFQLLCGRHNVIKKNFWDDQTGKLNTVAILQAIPEKDKKLALDWLNGYFN